MSKKKLGLDTLIEMARYGQGGSFVSFSAELETAVPGARVFPPTVAKGGATQYIAQTRNIGGEPMLTYVLDSPASHINRHEDALGNVLNKDQSRNSEALQRAYAVLRQINTIEVVFDLPNRPEPVVLRDYDMPGRGSDTLIRSAQDTVTKDLMDKAPDYVAAMKASVDDSLPLATLSPISLLFGTWDSRRPAGVKVPSLVSGETYGVSADQTRKPDGSFVGAVCLRGGTRNDPLASSWKNTVHEYLVEKLDVTAGIKTAKGEKKSAAAVGLGNVPHGGKGFDDGASLGGVSCSAVYRSTVIDLSALKRVGFRGIDAVDQEKGRAAFLALAVLLETLSSVTLNYRVGTVLDMLEESRSVKSRDANGALIEYEIPTIEEAATVLEEAIAAAPWLGWTGIARKCIGDSNMFNLHANDSEDAPTTAGNGTA